MALFGSKKKEEKKDAPKKEKAAVAAKSVAPAALPKSTAEAISVQDVLVRPRVTEKAANLTSQNVYTFDIRKSANKKTVAAAVKKLYKVTPIKIAIVNTPAKKVPMRKRRGFGMTNAGRKAYVTLKKGEEISFS